MRFPTLSQYVYICICHYLIVLQNREQHETITALKHKLKKQLSSSKLAIKHEIGDNNDMLDCSTNNNTALSCLDNEMLRAVYILKADVNTVISVSASYLW